MSEKFTYRTFYANSATYTKEEGWISKTTVEKNNPRGVDREDFGKKLCDIYEELDGKGFDVVNVTPIQWGTSESSITSRNEYLGDKSWSCTHGAVVIGKKREG